MALPAHDTRPRQTTFGAWLLGLLGLLTLISIGWRPFVHRGLYDVDRGLAAWRQERMLHGYLVRRLPHFVIYYTPTESKDVSLIAGLAQKSYPIETRTLRIFPNHPIPIVIEPSVAALNLAVGLPANDANLGVYWEGVARVLSPQAWLGQGPNVTTIYARSGPLPHELGHALLNLKADGNYPAWFNEGVAQWEDWRVTGYQWITKGNSLRGPLYSMGQLSARFYRLPNQALAYREGLSLVRFLRARGSQSSWLRFLDTLRRGTSFSYALRQVYRYPSVKAFFRKWYQDLHRTHS